MANKSIYVTMPTLAPLEEVTQIGRASCRERV